MKTWPEFNEYGDLPPGVHAATLEEITRHFSATPRRTIMARRLERIFQLACSTGHLARFIIFGSFITAKSEPNDVDIFLLMEDSFDVRQVSAEARLVFDHAAAQNRLRECFGFAAPPRSVAKQQPLPIGKSSAAAANVA